MSLQTRKCEQKRFLGMWVGSLAHPHFSYMQLQIVNLQIAGEKKTAMWMFVMFSFLK